MKNPLQYGSSHKMYGLLLLILFSTAGAYAQHEVTGVVSDAETGEPLVGVNILFRGTQSGTTTDINGEYEFRAPSPDGVLVFSYLGYRTTEIPIEGRDIINVNMEIDEILGDELVVVGYGVQRRRDVTGSIGRVEGERISRLPTQSVDQALQGVTSGIQVTPASGAPGASAIIRIRGVGTLNDASPLFVVDGMTMDNINFLNPNDIESVDVLKDASATAIYGARGANGVIMVTTKRSRIDRPTEFDINFYQGWQQVARTVPVTNAREYAILANEAAANENRTAPFDNPEEFGIGTDWQDEIFRIAPMRNLSVRASGGTDNTTYSISGNYTTQDGIIHQNYLDRYSLRLNNDYYVTDNIQFGHNVALVYEDYQNAPGVVGSAYRGDPTVPVYNEEGNYSATDARASVGNPVASLDYNSNNENSRNRVVGNAYTNITFLDHFMFRTNLGIDVNRTHNRNYSPIFFVSPIQQNEQTSLSVGTNYSYNILWENTLQFQRELNNHRFDVLVGQTMEEFKSEGLGGSRINIVGDDPSLWYLQAGDGSDGMTNFNSAFDWSMLSFLGRINYAFMNRYLATVSLRRDGSSRFGRENRFGWFPSFALGWIITDEPFMPELDWLEQIKFRGSWGQTGNDKIDAYPGRATVAANLNAVFGPGEEIVFGALPISLANPQIQWEETTQYNIGMEAAFFSGRLSTEFEYYDRITDGILVQVPIPGYVGVDGQPFVNAAEVSNSGVELSLRWQDSPGGFFYSLGANFTTITNEVLSLGRGNEDIFGGGVGVGGLLSTKTVVGRPIGSFFGFKTDGIFQNADEIAAGPLRGGEQPGDLRFLDTTGDGQITNDDRIHLGSPIPDYLFSFNVEFAFRGFDLSAIFTGQAGNQIYNAKKQARFGTPNFERSALNRWTGEGTSTTHPRITDGGHNYLVSDFFIEDGDYLKFHNLTLGYTLSSRISQMFSMSSLRIYASGTNLYTWTGYDGYTPEVASGSVISTGIDSAFYPFARTFNIGINARF
jgi:TonB-linked SusC/RagA family outer membrane protein